MSLVRFIAIGAVVFTLVSCSRDPARKVESGNKYYDRGKYRDAIILYRNAIKLNPKYGEAYYHLALAELKLELYQESVNPLRRAIELLPHDNPDWLDSNIQYAEVMLPAVPGTRPVDRGQMLAEIQGIKNTVLAKNPNSFEGLRLLAELATTDAFLLTEKGRSEEARQKLEEAAGVYRKVLAVKPGETKVMLSLGKNLVLAGKTDEAEQIFRQVIDKDKSLIGPYQDLFKLYMAKQRQGDAEAILKLAIATHPADTSLQYQLALFYFSTVNQAEMTKVLATLKANAKQDPNTFLRLGDFYTQIGKNDEAIKSYQEGIANNSAIRMECEKRIIQVLFRKGKTDEAYQKVQEILKKAPKDLDARQAKAGYLLSKGNFDPAIAEFQSLVNDMPNNYAARTALGRAYFAKQDFEQSTRQFEAALAINPNYAPPRLALAKIALQQRNWDRALPLAQATLKASPTSGDAQLIEGTAYVHKGEFAKARAVLEPLVKANPNRMDPLAELAVLDMFEKRYKESEDLFRKAYEADPSSVRGILGVAEVRMKTKDVDGAIQAIADEVKKQPQRVDLKRELANIELQGGRYDKALEDYRSVMGQYGKEPAEQAEIYGRIGQTLEMKGDFPQAIEYYRKAKQLAPGNSFYIQRVGDLYSEAGQTREALAAYREGIKLDPNNPTILNDAAYMMSLTGENLDEALTLAQRAKQQVPSFYDAADTIGWIYFRKGSSDNAIEVFKDLTTRAQDNPTYHYHYGMVLVQKGDKANALKEFKAALKSNPSKTEEAEIKEQVQRLS